MRKKNVVILVVLFLFLFLIWSGETAWSQEAPNAEQIIQKTLDTMYPSGKVEKIKGKRYSEYLYAENGSLISYVRGELVLPETFEETIYLAGNKIRKQRKYRNGVAEYFVNGQATDDEAVLASIEAQAQRLSYKLFSLYRHVRNEHQYDFIGEEEVNGRPCYVVEFEKEDNLKERFYIDKESFLILKRQGEFLGESGKYAIIGVFDDYRQIDGIQVPFLFREYFGDGRLRVMVEISDFSFIF